MTETEEVTNPEGAEATEEEIVTTENDSDSEQEEEIDPRDAKIAELENKNKSLYEKLKWGYKKHAKVNENYVSKDEVKNLIKEVETERLKETELINKYDDAKELLPEVRKLQREKWLDIDTAYDLVRWKMLRDEWYRNQIQSERTANYGTMKQTEAKTKADSIFSQWPKIAQKND